MSTSTPTGNGARPRSPIPRRASAIWLLISAVVLFAALFFGPDVHRAATTQNLPYSTFLTDVHQHRVSTVSVGSTGQLTGTLKSGQDFTSQAPVWALTTNGLAGQLGAAGVKVSAYQEGDTLRQIVASLLPTLLIVIGIMWFARRAQRALASSAGGGLAGLVRTKSRVTEAERPRTRFVDVAGYDGVKHEITEVVDYLRNPARYLRAGATGPRGVLLVGPPGTGKTLLARAVAGEASVPFYATTGSSFVEMFVGLGASRVRELFADARRNAPAIVFIDEIDALGARRGVAAAGGHDEREQTLNQLLAEMDGFTGDSSVVVLANTNRPEALDPALLRPGRFDRQVQVPLPVLRDREQILTVHTRGKRLQPGTDLSLVARGTPGFSGADLANLVNEAALRAARNDRDALSSGDFEAARERLILGRTDDGTALLPDERRRVAVHEGGHALTAALLPTSDPVEKITILPAGMSLGATHQLPVDERRLYPRQHLEESLAVRLAGRAAEQVVLGQASTGAANDLAGATELALHMVREYGFSDRVGPVGYPRRTAATDPERPYAEATQRLVDAEVARLLREAEHRAAALVVEHRAELDELVDRLLDAETLDGSVVYDVIRATTLEEAR